jgi:hypothetical protein
MISSREPTEIESGSSNASSAIWSALNALTYSDNSVPTALCIRSVVKQSDLRPLGKQYNDRDCARYKPSRYVSIPKSVTVLQLLMYCSVKYSICVWSLVA